MSYQTMRLTLAALALAAFAACAGGSTGSGVVPGPAALAPAPVPIADAAASGALGPDRRPRPKKVKGVVSFIIPPRVRHHKGHYISGATLGAKIVAVGGGMTLSTNFNLSPLSGNCPAGSHGVHICTIAAEVPVGDDTLTVTFYDQVPSGGGFAGADILSTGSVTQTVAAGGSPPAIVIYAGGVIGSIGATPAFASLPADGSTHDAGMAVAPEDFGNQPITAGSKDPYNNPITVTLTESGGSGHATLVYTGGSGATATLTKSSDTVEVQYDGGGSAGYLIKVSFAATGAPTQHLQVAPMYVSSASNMFNGTKLQLQGTQASADMTVSEAGNSGSQTYTSVPNGGCTNVATSTPVSDSGGTAVFTITGGATNQLGGCSIAFSDGVSTIHVPASNTLAGGGATLPGSVVSTFPVPNPVGISTAAPTLVTVGPDQHLWFVDTFASVQSSDTSGNVTTNLLGGTSPQDLTAGPDGAMWITDIAGPSIVRLLSGAATKYPVPAGTQPIGITNGPDGALWFTDIGCGAVDRISITGAVTQTLLADDAANPTGIAAGPDNAVWFTESATGIIGRLATDGSFNLNESNVTPSGASSAPQSIALGPDGQMWFTEPGTDNIGSVSTDGSFTFHEYAVTGSPSIIARGPDDAMYFITTGAKPIGRISLKAPISSPGSLSYFSLPGGGANPAGIVSGPDGNVWYTLAGSSQLVQMTP